MADEAHDWTDKRIAKTERSMKSLYDEAKRRMAKLIEDELAELDLAYEDGAVDEVLLAMLSLGYDEGLARRLATIAVETDMEASKVANSQTEDVYRKNAGFMLLVLIGMFDRLAISGKPTMTNLPTTRVDVAKDFSWNLRKMRSALRAVSTDSTPSRQAVDAMSRVVDMDMRTAVRSARTLATRTEAVARLDAIKKAVDSGAKVEKQWVAVMDNRTRETHAGLDGTHVPVDEPFVTFKGVKLMYPADPDCNEPSEVYNCRCTIEPWSDDSA